MAFPKFYVLFNSLMKSISKQQVDEILDTFSNNHTNVERFALALKNLQNFKMLPFENGSQELDLVDKSATKSEEWRLMANKTFSTCKDQLDEALVQYTRSVACAPHPARDGQNSAEELALAYGNRSLVLLKMNKPEASLSDIQRALDCNYPQNLRYKLYVRQGKCYQQMGKIEEANNSFQKALELLALAPLSPKGMESAMSEIKMLQHQASSPETKPAKVKLNTLAPPTVSYKPHKTVPCASSCVDVKFSQEMGRYIEANRDIKPGDVLIVEDPYAAVLLPGFYYTHCYKCFQRSNCLLPCKCCPQVMYCSSACRDTSWTEVHRYECPVLPQLLDLDMGQDWLLALRTLLVTSHRSGGLSKAVQAINVVNPEADAAGNFEYIPADPCNSIYNLSQHRDDRTFSQAFRLALVSVFVMNALAEKTSLLAAFDPPFSSVGGLLLHTLQSLPSNCYSVADLVLTGGTTLTTESFGVAVYATAGLVNHSCDANTVRSYHGGAGLSIIASRPIGAGEQIFCDYGFSYNQFSLEERQKHLQSNYFFTCKCEACIEDWPQDDVLSIVEPIFLCSQCSSPLLNADSAVVLTECGRCHHKQSLAGLKKELQDVLETYVKIKVLLLSGFRQDFTQELAALLVVLNRIVERPNKAIVDVTDALRHNAMQAGNFYTVKCHAIPNR